MENQEEIPVGLQKKQCKVCGEWKIRLDFYKGHQCKACIYQNQRKNKIKTLGEPNPWTHDNKRHLKRAVDLI